MFSFCVLTLGPHQMRRTGSRNAFTPKTLPVPHSIVTDRFENVVLTTSEDPINHTAVSNKFRTVSLHLRLHTKIFRSVTNKRFDTYGIFTIIKVSPNNTTVNQVSRTIAYTIKKSHFVHTTNWQSQAFGKTNHQIQQGEFFFLFFLKIKQVLIQQ